MLHNRPFLSAMKRTRARPHKPPIVHKPLPYWTKWTEAKLTNSRWNVRKIKICGEIIFSDNKLKIIKLSPSWQSKKGRRGFKKKKSKEKKTVCLDPFSLCPLQGAEGDIGCGILWRTLGGRWMDDVALACSVEIALLGSLHAVAKARLRYLLTVSCRGRLIAIAVGLLWGHGDAGSRC